MKYRTNHHQRKCACTLTHSSFLSFRLLRSLISSQICLGLCLFASVLQVLSAQSLGPAIHRTPKPITFATPTPAKTFTATNVPVRVHIAGGLDPANFTITLNGKDITKKFSQSGSCNPESCDESGSLSSADGIRTGWNHLHASASSDSGAVDVAQLRFFYNSGLLGDSTNSSTPPFDVSIAVQSNGDISLGYVPNTIGGSTVFKSECTPTQWSVMTIDRESLTKNEATCYDDVGTLQIYLAARSYTEIVAGRGPMNSPTGNVDMSSIGGFYFPPNDPSPAYDYTFIGYGQNSQGAAYESYTENGDNPPVIEGVLENVTGGLYAFRPADQPGFTVSYPNNTAQIEIKYNNDLPLGTVSTPNRITPTGLDMDTKVAACSAPGICMAFFFRQTLQSAGTILYAPTTGDPVTAYKQLTAEINALMSGNSQDALIFLVISQPQNFPVPPNSRDNAAVIENLSNAIQSLGGSAQDFWQAVRTGKHYALVATTTSDNLASDKWYSTEVDTQQNESGLLHGLLQRNQQLLFTPIQVVPITTTSAENPDQVWAGDITAQLGGTRPVPWPLTGDSDHLLAYAFISRILVNTIYYGREPLQYFDYPCTEATCDDVRFYYTGSEASGVANKSPILTDDDLTTLYNKAGGQAALGFTFAALKDQRDQLSMESAYLANSLALQNYVSTAFSNAQNNIALNLTSAAGSVTDDLNAALHVTNAPAPLDKVALGANILSDVASLASIVSGGGTLADTNPVSGAAGIFSGILSTAASIMNTVNAATQPTPADNPNVVQLADLYSTDQNTATKTATNFSGSLLTSTTTFFTRVYSDWYRLQSVGLMAVNTDSTNSWYIAQSGPSGPPGTLSTTGNNYLASMLAGARKQFYMAILPTHFVVDTYIGLADGYNLGSMSYLLDKCYGTSNAPDFSYNNPGPSVYPNYPWNYDGNMVSLLDGPWTEGGNYYSLPGRDVWVIRTQPNSQGAWGFWTQMGDALMGAANNPDGSGQLNLNQNWFFESNIVPKSYLGCPAGGGSDNFNQH